MSDPVVKVIGLGNVRNVPVALGPKGEKGDPGVPGANGAPGIPGATGSPGARGDAGPMPTVSGTGFAHVTGGTWDTNARNPTASEVGADPAGSAAAVTLASLGGVSSGDSRLSDARSPTAHAGTHATSGSDPITISESQVANLTADLAAKATAASITPATATKVTVNAQGVVTATASSTTADITDSTNKRYVTDAEKGLADRVPLTLHTGVIDGCVISINAIDNTKLDISAGHTQYVDDSNPNSPVVETLTVAATTVTPVVGASGLDTLFKIWVGIARTQPGIGTPQFSNLFFASSDRRRISVLGTCWSANVGSNVIAAASDYPSPAWGAAKTLEDLFYALGGSINVDGNFFSAHPGQLTLDKSAGHAVRLYGAASLSKDDPNNPTASAASPVASYRYWAASGTSYGNALSSTIDPNYYDNAGTRTAVPEGNWTIQRVYWFPSTSPTPIVAISYGQAVFDTLDAAKAAANTQTIIFSDLATNGFFGGILRTRLYVQQGATDLSGAFVENMSQFVAGGAGSGGGSVTDHAMLAHLDYASAGHTGFAPSNAPTFIGTITRTGTGTPAVLPGNAIEVYDTVSGATLQTNIQNLASDGSASTDIVATADNGSNIANFVDVGINSSGYNDSGYTSGGPDDAYLLSIGGNLAIISGTASKSILFFTGGTTIDKLRATLADAGLSIVGTVLASNLSGTNTGDETATTIESKLGVSSGNAAALANLSGTNTGDQTLSGLGGVPTGRKINGYDLTQDRSLSASDVGADMAGAAAAITLAGLGGVSTSQTVNGHALSAPVTVSVSDFFPDCGVLLL